MATAATISSLLGERQSGQDVRSGNVAAVQTVANVLRSSLGPQGLDKMLVDDIGDVTITNDGATVLKQLEIQHPAAQLLCELSDLQDQEVGDGTTSVVLIAAELLKRADQLVKSGVHPTSIIAGYKLAMKEAVKYINQHLTEKVDSRGRALLLNVAETTLSSKFIGAEAKHFASLVVDAMLAVKTTDSSGKPRYPVTAINILKTQGKSAKESTLYSGYALSMMSRAAQGMPSHVANAKIALLDMNLRQHRMHFGVQIQIEDPRELERVREKERDLAKQKIQKILDSGANVVLTTQGIDDMSLKYFVEAGVFAVRRVNKKDMQRIAKATGGHLVLTMATMEGEEHFDPAWLGQCESVLEERVGDWDYVFLQGCKESRAMSLVLRGANDMFLEEVERSVHDALCAVSRTLENNVVCAGGGAVESALSVYLEDFARTLGSREQLAIAEFAEALLVIPKTLALNATSKDPLDLLAKLRRAHYLAQQSSFTPSAASPGKWTGLDLLNLSIRDNLAAGVVEPAISKTKMIRFATEAAVTILRIDDVIKVDPEPTPQRDDD